MDNLNSQHPCALIFGNPLVLQQIVSNLPFDDNKNLSLTCKLLRQSVYSHHDVVTQTRFATRDTKENLEDLIDTWDPNLLAKFSMGILDMKMGISNIYKLLNRNCMNITSLYLFIDFKGLQTIGKYYGDDYYMQNWLNNITSFKSLPSCLSKLEKLETLQIIVPPILFEYFEYNEGEFIKATFVEASVRIPWFHSTFCFVSAIQNLQFLSCDWNLKGISASSMFSNLTFSFDQLQFAQGQYFKLDTLYKVEKTVKMDIVE